MIIRLNKNLTLIYKNFFALMIKYSKFIQILQLTVIYFFALVDLIYSILSTILSLGYSPEIVSNLAPFIRKILESPLLRVWASPEKVFFLSYVVIEFLVIKSYFQFSKLVKYNLLFVFSLLMLQGLVISYWDLLFNRQIAFPVTKWIFDQNILIFTDKPLAITFFFSTFIFFFILYIVLYLKALQGQYAVIPGIHWLTDSISFWLRVKTPTMRYGESFLDQ